MKLVLLTFMTILGVEAYDVLYDGPGADYADFNDQEAQAVSQSTEAMLEEPPKESVQILKDALERILPKYNWDEHFKTSIGEETTASEIFSKPITKQLLEKVENKLTTRIHWQIPLGSEGTEGTQSPTRTSTTYITRTSNSTNASSISTNYIIRTTEPIDFFHNVWMGFDHNVSVSPTRTTKTHLTRTRKIIRRNRTVLIKTTKSTTKNNEVIFDLETSTNIGRSYDVISTNNGRSHDVISKNNERSYDDGDVISTSTGRSEDSISTNIFRSREEVTASDDEICDNNLTFTEDDDAANVLMPNDEDLRKRFGTTESYERYVKNLTGVLMGKCYVCGLKEEKIPYDTSCKDAFAGEFFPLIAVDNSARSRIKTFRTYCRWRNLRGYQMLDSTKTMVGRWTGGCAVRWVDVSGVYSQRTCRNRHRPVMGKHWASKRMAKLELALQHLDDGCIISPTASLLPLSRGISLYARFHVCVCSGFYCNAAVFSRRWSAFTAIFTFVFEFLWCN